MLVFPTFQQSMCFLWRRMARGPEAGCHQSISRLELAYINIAPEQEHLWNKSLPFLPVFMVGSGKSPHSLGKLVVESPTHFPLNYDWRKGSEDHLQEANIKGPTPQPSLMPIRISSQVPKTEALTGMFLEILGTPYWGLTKIRNDRPMLRNKPSILVPRSSSQRAKRMCFWVPEKRPFLKRHNWQPFRKMRVLNF